jgi:hypothetical protein
MRVEKRLLRVEGRLLGVEGGGLISTLIIFLFFLIAQLSSVLMP